MRRRCRVGVKEELREYRWMRRHTELLEEQLMELKGLMRQCGAVAMDGLPKGNGGGDKTGSMVVQVAELEAQLQEALRERVILRERITGKIGRIGDERYRCVLIGYYVLGLSWERVAEKCGYSLQHVYRLHGGALEAYREVDG